MQEVSTETTRRGFVNSFVEFKQGRDTQTIRNPDRYLEHMQKTRMRKEDLQLTLACQEHFSVYVAPPDCVRNVVWARLQLIVSPRVRDAHIAHEHQDGHPVPILGPAVRTQRILPLPFHYLILRVFAITPSDLQVAVCHTDV